MTYSTGIYRRLDFGINIPDESLERPGQCVPLKEVAESGPTRKRKISDVLSSEEDSNSVSLGGKAMRRSPRIVVKALKGLLESQGINPRAVSSGTQGLQRSADIKKAGGRSLST